jgi:hypothetical protein
MSVHGTSVQRVKGANIHSSSHRGPGRRSCRIRRARGEQAWREMLNRTGPAIVRSIQMKKSGRAFVISIRIENSGGVTLYSARLGYYCLFCSASSSSCSPIGTSELPQIPSTAIVASTTDSPRRGKLAEPLILFLKATFSCFHISARSLSVSSRKYSPVKMPLSEYRGAMCGRVL